MLSLTFGLIAALAWGIHDVCASTATARTGIPMTMLAILTFGLCLVGPAALILGDWTAITLPSLSLAAMSGATYTLAAFGLYRAFNTVSYTHLDVYKRQISWHPTTWRFSTTCKSRRLIWSAGPTVASSASTSR